MTGENSGGPNDPIEFKILEKKDAGFNSVAWFNGTLKLGSDKELERILNELGAEGWDIIHVESLVVIILRRRAR